MLLKHKSFVLTVASSGSQNSRNGKTASSVFYSISGFPGTLVTYILLGPPGKNIMVIQWIIPFFFFFWHLILRSNQSWHLENYSNLVLLLQGSVCIYFSSISHRELMVPSPLYLLDGEISVIVAAWSIVLVEIEANCVQVSISDIFHCCRLEE